MPLVNIPRDPLFEALGRTFTEVEFEELCWDFGIELDEVVTEEVKGTNTRGKASDDAPAEEVVFKVEVPANRYDILCLEGMVRALAVFLGTGSAPEYKLLTPPGGKALQMIVEPSTAQIRPFVVCAVLRNCSFTERAYNSFLDLQDKFHHNICRRRTLVAIGTHDLSKLTPPFRYRALPPKDISFVPLAQEQEYDAASLFAMYEKSNSPIKKFLPIIASSPVYPVIYDAKDAVLSLPPIINGNHSRISKDTKDVFIECTGTDLTKLNTVLNNIVAMFSEYTSMLKAAPWRCHSSLPWPRLGGKPSGLGRSKHCRGAPQPLRPRWQLGPSACATGAHSAPLSTPRYSSSKFSVEPVDVVYPAGPSHPKLAAQTVRTPPPPPPPPPPLPPPPPPPPPPPTPPSTTSTTSTTTSSTSSTSSSSASFRCVRLT